MNLAFLTPGTGSYYCGACMRDNALAKSLITAGHEVSLLPMYLPLQLDEAPAKQSPIFFGGINIYLQQKLPFFRHTPVWFDKLLDRTSLLRAAAKRSHMTSPREHGEMALAMLEIEDSPFHKETTRLIDWLAEDPPDLIVLSNALLAAFAKPLKRRLDCPVMTFFQGEDSFLDGLPDPYREKCWAAMKHHLAESDLLVSPSQFYADLIRDRLASRDFDIEVMPNGVATNAPRDSSRAPENPSSKNAAQPPDSSLPTSHSALSTGAHRAPTIGYLARMIREKGLELLVDAFIHLRLKLQHPDARLHIAGSETASDKVLVHELKQRLENAGLTKDVTWLPNLEPEHKAGFLRNLTLFSVPAIYHEAFGLYTIEALAAGIPLVMPRSSSFPEIIETSEAGILCEPNDAASLANAWNDLLQDDEQLSAFRKNAIRAAQETYSIEAMRDRFLGLARSIQDTPE